MEIRNSEMPCKIRKRRFPTASTASFANNSLPQFLMDKTESPQRNEKYCVNKSNRNTCDEEKPATFTLQKSGTDNRVNEVVEKSIANVERSRTKSCTSPGRVYVPKDKSQPCDDIQTVTKESKVNGQSMHVFDEINHALTVSRELLKLLTHVWTEDPNHDHRNRTSISLASKLNHELNKARYHVNKLIEEQRYSTQTSAQESKEQDKIRFAVKTISRELETERKLRRQSERMNKKLGRELANTKSLLAKSIKKAESERKATEILERLCEKMAQSIEEDRVELEELKRESERVRKEMEEERQMLRVADMLREERVHMKLIDAKYEYEDKHEQVNILVRDLEELLKADNDVDHLTPTWHQSHYNYNRNKNKNGENTWDETMVSFWHEKEKGNVLNDENTLSEVTRGLPWFENKGDEVVNDEMTNTQNEVMRRNSDCIEFDMKNDSEDLNEFSEDIVIGLESMKEYEDEMERYKMIKDLRDRIVSGGSDLSRDTINEFGSYM